MTNLNVQNPYERRKDRNTYIKPLKMGSSPPMTLDDLPFKILSRVYSILIPDRFEFLGRRATVPSRWPQNPILAFLQVFPHLVEEVNGELYSCPRFEFKTSRIRKSHWIHALEVAGEFFGHIAPENVNRIRFLSCDLHWQKRSEDPNEIFQLLERLAACPPKREIRNIDFNFEPSYQVKRSISGIRSQPFAFSLRGLLGVDMIIFIVGLHGLLPNPWQFVPFMNKWIQGRREVFSPYQFLAKTPPELHKEIYEYFDLPKHFTVRRKITPKARPSNCLSLLLHHPTMTAGLLALFYGGCHFEFIFDSTCLAHRRVTSDASDPRSWVTPFLCQIGPVNASYIRKATIQVSVCNKNRYDYIPTLRSVIMELKNRCAFHIDEKYLSEPSKENPREWNMSVHGNSYVFKIPTQANAT